MRWHKDGGEGVSRASCPSSGGAADVKEAWIEGSRRQDGQGGRPGRRADLVLRSGQQGGAGGPAEQRWPHLELHTLEVTGGRGGGG